MFEMVRLTAVAVTRASDDWLTGSALVLAWIGPVVPRSGTTMDGTVESWFPVATGEGPKSTRPVGRSRSANTPYDWIDVSSTAAPPRPAIIQVANRAHTVPITAAEIGLTRLISPRYDIPDIRGYSNTLRLAGTPASA